MEIRTWWYVHWTYFTRVTLRKDYVPNEQRSIMVLALVCGAVLGYSSPLSIIRALKSVEFLQTVPPGRCCRSFTS